MPSRAASEPCATAKAASARASPEQPGPADRVGETAAEQ